MAFAKGKYSKAISDRSGLEFPYTEMVKEWNGMLVHSSEFEPKQPQLDPKPKGSDPQYSTATISSEIDEGGI